MKNKLPLVLIILTLIIIIVIGIRSNSNNDVFPTPVAEDGILDLRDYNFQNGVVKLNGEWEFIPNDLADSAQFGQNKSHLVQVPSLWTKYEIDGKKLFKFTKGTYRLKILLDEDDREEILGIKTTNIRMSNSIYVNGKLIGGSGQPGDKDSYVQHNIPYTTYFHTDKEEIEILVQVANFDYASGGGIVGSIYFGNQEGVAAVSKSSLFYDWVTIIAFLTMFVYFLGTYLHFRKDMETLCFSLFCLAVVVYYASHGEKLMLSVIPNMSYEIFERIQMLSSVCFGVFLLLYFYNSFKYFSNKKMVKILTVLGLLLMATSLLPVRVNSQLQMVYSSFLFVIILYIFIIQLKAIKHKAVGAVYLVLSSVTIFVYFIVATLNVISDFQLNLLPPVMPFILLSMLSLFISNRFTHSYLKKEELSNALIRVDKLKDEFLAKTSHEFRTPLHGIMAISQALLDKNETKMSSQEKEKVSLIMNIAKRLSHLVNDILDYSKLQQGELKLSMTPVDLHALSHVITEIFTFMIEKDVKLHNHVPRGQYVLADEGRLRQILYNLFDNAVRYTDSGTIEINSFINGGKVTIEVKDTGIGIPPDHIDILFDAFQQFENSIGGTGLGLSITKQLVEVQGGEIAVHSQVGKGTTFSISLPAAQPIEKENSLAIPIHYEKDPITLSLPYRNEKEGKRILIVDDDHVNLKVLIDTLDNEPYSIIAVDNGMAVFDEIKKNPSVDLILLDIMMPGISGYEVCQKLRKSYTLSELPILMLTAAINPEDMIAAFQAGANDFLHKPFEASELKTRIRNLLLMKESSEMITKIEVAFLQAQIKPHFIYNVLNTILSLSYTDLEKSRTMITDFATFLRGSFTFENTSRLVPLEKELSLIKSYVNIHRTRFPNQLDLEIDMDESFYCMIPPLILQPLVENAIIHGLRNKSKGGKVKLIIKESNKQVMFHIIDNGKGISKENLESIWDMEKRQERGVGLLNIAKRLKHYEHTSIQINSDEQGTSVEIKFPLVSESLLIS
ncbi:ATP-binding protein [Cytobacillus sp. FJAT-53684]|uniref:histidine kinase n=1 Tax=Cytobacillus mangrovibacter TaxID=3299024 RepID=A0ABW6K0B9_9BACI